MNNQLPNFYSETSRKTLGWLAVFGSAFFFYLATLIIRWAEPYVTIESAYFVFARLFLGFIIVCITMAFQNKRLHPRKYHYLIGRTLANTVAVFCFYKAVELGSVAEANILNMTYPLFVAIFSWFFLRGQRDLLSLLIVAIAFCGVWLVLSPGKITPDLGNLWGLCSGITAAIAIIYLNISRRYHDSQTILFFMFGLGTTLMLIFFHDSIFIPNTKEFFFLFSCSVAGVLGQYLITYGFLFVTAVEGSIISSSRILLAAILGPILVAGPSLTISGWCGALLIFAANTGLALRKV
ncbi:EamA-like transporter family protein [Desulfuromusa kysingii]|uniref:EamA-like transporter family protein n=1 Tax=Desulfuromusa kysingii TaxID=37625 RepID=A0A1H3YVW4_9BACT|nr:DMT family transporter [Desulfuromusa kysingii]SEA15550.1 EamA-like transporter family protein [Desulfuromusa kysingii]